MATETIQVNLDINMLCAGANAGMRQAAEKLQQAADELWGQFVPALKGGALVATAQFERAMQQLMNEVTPPIQRTARALVYEAARLGARDAGGSWNGVVDEALVSAPGTDLSAWVASAMASDVAASVRAARHFAQLYTVATWRGASHEAAVESAARSLGTGDVFGDTFRQLDRVGRSYRTAFALSAEVRMAMRHAYNDRFLLELQAQGLKELQLHDSGGSTLLSINQWVERATRQLHPNAQWRLSK